MPARRALFTGSARADYRSNNGDVSASGRTFLVSPEIRPRTNPRRISTEIALSRVSARRRLNFRPNDPRARDTASRRVEFRTVKTATRARGKENRSTRERVIFNSSTSREAQMANR